MTNDWGAKLVGHNLRPDWLDLGHLGRQTDKLQTPAEPVDPVPHLPAPSTHGVKFYTALIVLTDKRPAEPC